MRLVIVMIAVVLGGSLACDKGESELGKGVLLGFDFRKCASPYCSGWLVEIAGDTLRFLEIPEKSDLDLQREISYPIPVEIEWGRYQNEWSHVEDLIKVRSLFRMK